MPEMEDYYIGNDYYVILQSQNIKSLPNCRVYFATCLQSSQSDSKSLWKALRSLIMRKQVDQNYFFLNTF